MLIKNLAFDGKDKLADKWEEDTYVVVKQPNAATPVHVVKKETGIGRSRIMHRNRFLPFGSNPVKVSDTTVSAKPPPIPSKRQRCEASDNTGSTPVITVNDAEHITDTSSVSDSEDQFWQLEIQGLKRPSMDISEDELGASMQRQSAAGSEINEAQDKKGCLLSLKTDILVR